ncbi:MAG: hypothetical protein IJ071_10610 [Ruminococcus sp.]|nr:hypothetical protein [Ruminococcus sp.]
METAHTIIGAALALSAIGLMLLVPAEAIAEEIRLRRAYKAARAELEFDFRVWTSIAKSCDTIKDAEERGYAVARLVLINHDIEVLDENYEKGA